MKHDNSIQPIRILGIDPGLRSTGFGVIEMFGKQLSYIASGCITSDAQASLPLRIKSLLDGIAEVVSTYQPQQAAVEIVFVNVNPQSTLLLGQARGAAISALVSADLPVSEYTALQVNRQWLDRVRQLKNKFSKWSCACWRCRESRAATQLMRWLARYATPMAGKAWAI